MELTGLKKNFKKNMLLPLFKRKKRFIYVLSLRVT